MKKKPQGTLGPSKQVTYRMPSELYAKLLKIAESMFQPMPVVLRAAAAEYARNHRPVRHKNTGLELKWEDVPAIVKEASLHLEREKEDEQPADVRSGGEADGQG